MNSSNRTVVMLLLVAGLVAGGIYWSFSHSNKAGKPHVAGHVTSPEKPTAAEQAENGHPADETIEFPRELWASASLKVEPARTEPIHQAITLTGKIALNEDKLAHIFPLVEGRVDEVQVQFGQHVKKDEVLVIVQSKEVGQGMLELYHDRHNLEIAVAKDQWTQEVGKNTLALIEMMRSDASIDDIEAGLKDRTMGEHREKLMTAYLERMKAQVHLERLTPLSGTGAVPARQLLEAETSVNTDRAILRAMLEQTSQDVVQASRMSQLGVHELKTRIAATETNLKILGFRDKDLQNIDVVMQGEKLAHYPVTAPFDGTIISKDVVLMERVGPDRQILTIADLSTVWVSADIYETHLPLLAQLGDKTVKVHCEVWPDKVFEARVFYTGDVVQENTRTLSLRAIADNANGQLKPGMFVTVELPSLQTASVLQVPLTAIQDHEGKSFVFVETGAGQFHRHDVKLGRNSRDAVEILEGLKEGDSVVVDGGFALKSKMLADLLSEE